MFKAYELSTAELKEILKTAVAGKEIYWMCIEELEYRDAHPEYHF
jgi:hypothetical protein